MGDGSWLKVGQSLVFLGRREEGLGVVRNSKRDMHALCQSSQPSGVRTVGAEPAPLERTAGDACPEGSQSSESARRRGVSKRRGQRHRGFCWGQTDCGRVKWEGIWRCRSQAQGQNGACGEPCGESSSGSEGWPGRQWWLRGIKTLTEITLQDLVRYGRWSTRHGAGHTGLDRYLFLLRKDFRASSYPPAQPSTHSPLSWWMRKRNVKI